MKTDKGCKDCLFAFLVGLFLGVYGGITLVSILWAQR